jgi:YD repeat-containing protein
VLFTFGYGLTGLLNQVTDASGDVTSILRDGSGAPVAVVAPFGQRTELHVDAGGYLDSVRPDPGTAPYVMTYASASGLLESFTTPGGSTSTFGYDALGRLTSHTDPTATTVTFSFTDGPSQKSMVETGPDGTRTFAQQGYDNGGTTIASTSTDGTTSHTSASDAARRTQTLSDGTRFDSTLGEDPQWGAAAPVTRASATMPSGLRRDIATYRTATLAVPGNDPTQVDP